MSDQRQPETADLCYQWQTYWPHAVPNIRRLRATPDREDVTCPACLHALGSQKHPAPVYPPGMQTGSDPS